MKETVLTILDNNLKTVTVGDEVRSIKSGKCFRIEALRLNAGMVDLVNANGSKPTSCWERSCVSSQFSEKFVFEAKGW